MTLYNKEKTEILDIHLHNAILGDWYKKINIYIDNSQTILKIKKFKIQ